MKTTGLLHPLATLCLLTLSFALQAAPESIFPDTLAPTGRFGDAPGWELGTVFRPSVPGTIRQVRVYALATESGDHQIRIWRNADNTLLAGPLVWTYGGEEGWIVLEIPAVAVAANQDYTIAISAPIEGQYPAVGGYFSSVGSNGQNLDYPAGAGVLSDVAGERPTRSFANTAYLRDVVFEPDLSGTVMRVRGNGITIVDGATETTTANGTAIGGRSLQGGFRDQSYTVLNLGQAALTLTGSPKVAVSGADAADFTVTVEPDSTVAPGASTTFTVRFRPSALGPRNARLALAHADSPANAFDFAIQGTGLGGGAGVLGNDSEGAFARNIDSAVIVGNRFRAPVDLKLTQLRGRVLELAGIFKCAVYSDAGGVADRLLAGSLDVVNATNGWNAFPLSTPLEVVGGDWYWLVIWADTQGARVQADPVGTGYFGNYSFADLGGQWPDPISLTPLLGDAASRTYCLYAEGVALGAGPGPELDLRGNDKLIVAGDPSPSVLDGTDFGSANLGAATQEQTFVIQNPGSQPLQLSGQPVIQFSGAQAGDWTVTAPPTSPVPAGGSTTFKLRFSPAAPGLRLATALIENNDPEEGHFAFAIQGAGRATGQESIFPDTKVGRDIDFDGTAYELGTVFSPSVPGAVTQLRVFALPSESGDHTARIWRNDDESVVGGPYTWNYAGASGWITYPISPVDLDAGVAYTVAISTGTSPKRNYPNIAGDLTAPGGNRQHLTYPVNAGVFTDVRESRPTGSFNGGNYLRDVVFVPAGPESLFPDTKTGRDIDFDGAYYELGTVFNTTVAGKITHLRVYALASEAGDHTARLWRNSDDTVLGGPYTWNYAGASGWITLDIPDVDIEPGVDYTVSVSTGTSPKRNYPNIAADVTAAGGNGQHLKYPVNAGVFGETRDARPTGSFNGGNYLRDVVFLRKGVSVSVPVRIVESRVDATADSFTLRWEGGDGPFQVERATAVAGPYQAVGAAQAGRSFTDPNVRSSAASFYRVRQAQP